MRNRFDQELSALNNELIEMGALIERAIDDASRALLEKDPALARQAIGQGARVDEKEKQIERRCLRLLLPQPAGAARPREVSPP
ncbi:PhoU domain-containing protein, partial [uncultured Anaerotruncus sp.]|uniref:PhoU domain-containing protein n=1 Tax=uncultured Anaerotruncus sp. TaxID=905011 RepID=UPI00258423CC